MPKLLNRLAVALFAGVLIFLPGLMFWKGGLSPVFWAVLISCLAFAGALMRPLSTRIDERGVSQFSLTGAKQLLWSEIREVREEPLALVVIGPTESWHIPTWLFADANQAVKYLRSRMKEG